MSRGLVEIIGTIFAGKRKTGDHAPAVEIKLPGAEFAGIYSRNPHSSILASVLTSAQPDAVGDARSSAGRPATDSHPAPLSKRVGAGDEMRKAREALLASGGKLALLSDPLTASAIEKLLAMVETQHCSIAFIGQMNAGKSSLINAFAGAPKLLPTEITPWTTVVTNLYFGIPKQPTSGALFEFFNQSEWQQLAEGSARVRSLTEQLIPNFPWEDFYRQVGNMREKAQEKLGARYGELLGTQHAVPVVTLDVLEKYIAAESPLGEEDSKAGEFSMITKAAHLYFDLASFFYPTVVIDTPGINDPFLVRDEITRQNLERANVFVIVVTARQPLSNADLDLLRILRGLRKDNIVIFVNKADELGDEAGHASAIVDRIRVLLKKEFPGSDIPILMGSALWAEIALAEDLDEKREIAEIAGVDAPRSAPGKGDDGGFWFSGEDLEDAMLTDGILMRSGVPDLALAVAEMLRTGPVAGSIAYSASVLAAVARNGAARATENAALAERLADGNDGDALKARTEAAAGILAEIDGGIDALTAGFDAVLRDHHALMLERLNATLAASLAEWQAAPGKPGLAGLGTLAVKLRSALEQEFLAVFQDALRQMTGLSQEAGKTLHEQVANAAQVLETAIECPELPAVTSSPSLAALGEPVATDVGSLVQGRWGGMLAAPEKTEAMQSIVAGEFEAIAAKLADAAAAELRRSSGFIVEQTRVTVAQALRSAIEEQRSVLALAGDGPQALAARMQQEREAAENMTALAEPLAQAAVSS
jgi:GTP-binding protein EngB required for normal cell division